jgi:hypothetical protein
MSFQRQQPDELRRSPEPWSGDFADSDGRSAGFGLSRSGSPSDNVLSQQVNLEIIIILLFSEKEFESFHFFQLLAQILIYSEAVSIKSAYQSFRLLGIGSKAYPVQLFWEKFFS